MEWRVWKVEGHFGLGEEVDLVLLNFLQKTLHTFHHKDRNSS